MNDTAPSAFNSIHLAQRPPRSPRVRLGGYVILPRLLDKCRATISGTAGDYHFNCPLDQQFFEFTGIEARQLQQQAAAGLGDSALLAWITGNSPLKRTPWEIQQWSAYQDGRAPDLHTELYQYYIDTAAKNCAARGDLRSWFDLLDLDDYCSFGGTP